MVNETILCSVFTVDKSCALWILKTTKMNELNPEIWTRHCGRRFRGKSTWFKNCVNIICRNPCQTAHSIT